MEYSFEDAYAALTAPVPVRQASTAAMLRDFGTGAQLMADALRQTARRARADAGKPGEVTAEQAEAHADWFDTVAENSMRAADCLDTLAQAGTRHQMSAEQAYAAYQHAATTTSLPAVRAVAVTSVRQDGQAKMNQALSDWSTQYGALRLPAPPPIPTTTPAGAVGATPASTRRAQDNAWSDRVTRSPVDQQLTHRPDRGRQVPRLEKRRPPADTRPSPVRIPEGGTGSVIASPGAGEFRGWLHEPTTGFLIDPHTGREFDPTTSRWIDPVTGQPFGAVTSHATHLETAVGAETSAVGGLLDTSETGSGLAAALGQQDRFTVAAGYGGTLPPSLDSASSAVGQLWRQAQTALTVKGTAATAMITREQAIRTEPMPAPIPPITAERVAVQAQHPTTIGRVLDEDDPAALFCSRANSIHSSARPGRPEPERHHGRSGFSDGWASPGSEPDYCHGSPVAPPCTGDDEGHAAKQLAYELFGS